MSSRRPGSSSSRRSTAAASARTSATRSPAEPETTRARSDPGWRPHGSPPTRTTAAGPPNPGPAAGSATVAARVHTAPEAYTTTDVSSEAAAVASALTPLPLTVHPAGGSGVRPSAPEPSVP